VQGVGFRRFVYSLATRLGLAGFVGNDAQGVFAEVEGDTSTIERFVRSLREDAPPLAVVEQIVAEPLEPNGDEGFRIVESERPGSGRR
jgi:hydrogenase maturation protein HypF